MFFGGWRRAWREVGEVRHPAVVATLVGVAVALGILLTLREMELRGRRENFERAAQNRIRAISRSIETDLYGLSALTAAVGNDTSRPVIADEFALRACPFSFAAHDLTVLGFIPGRAPPPVVSLTDCTRPSERILIPIPAAWKDVFELAGRIGEPVATPAFSARIRGRERMVSLVIAPMAAPAGQPPGHRGFAAAILDHEALMEHAISFLIRYGVHVGLVDETPGTETASSPQLVAFHRSRRESRFIDPPTDLKTLDGAKDAVVGSAFLGGRRWRIFCLPVEGLLTPDPWTGVVASLGVLGSTFLLCAYIRAVRQRTLEIERQVVERTRELAEARDEAVAAVRVRSQFLANMSHEIRTPMNGVIGLADLLAATPLDFSQSDLLDSLRASARSLLEIVNDILDLSKIEAGGVTLVRERFELPELADRVVQTFAASAHQKGVDLYHILPPETLGLIEGDSTRLGQVLSNLIGNAVKFTERGSVAIRMSLFERRGAPSVLRCTVEDSGPGISPALQARLFQPFVQADGEFTRKHGGTGLGLAISRNLVKLMGGEIGVESEPGRGARFWFTAQVRRAERPAPSALAPSGFLGRRVVLIGDTPNIQIVVRTYVEEWGASIESFPDFEAASLALLSAAASGPLIVIADLDWKPVSETRHWMQNLDLLDVRMVLLAAPGQAYDAEVPLRFAPHWVPKPVRRVRLREALGRLTEEPAPVPPAPGPAEFADPVPGRILLVEDNLINQKVAQGLLAKLGYAVDTASSGQEAIESVRTAGYAAILMDCQMPGMDGFEATQAIRSLGGPPVPIIALTANAMPGDRERCLAAGMDDYLPKPIRIQQLGEVLERWTRAAVLP